MKALFYRLFSLALRFGAPIFILHLSTSAVLGEYYLFTSFFTMMVFLAGLEISVPFAKTYLTAPDETHQRTAFLTLFTSQAGLAAVLTAPAAVFYFLTTDVTAGTAVLLFAALVSETCVNEIGRFFWNVGLVHVASRRDLFRATFFAAAVIGSVIVHQKIVTPTSLSLLICLNAVLLLSELRTFGPRPLGAGRTFSPARAAAAVKRNARYIWTSVKASSPQVIHMQILSLLPFLERSLIKSKLGLDVVGAYSFQYSMIQSGATLLLLPSISRTRKLILSSESLPQWASAHRSSLFTQLRVFLVAAVCAGVSYFAIPLLRAVLHKPIFSDPYILVAALFSAAASTYATSIAPLYAKKSRILKANVITLALMSPLVLGYVLNPGTGMVSPSVWVMVLIAISACGQLLARSYHSVNSYAQQRLL